MYANQGFSGAAMKKNSASELLQVIIAQ